MGPLRNDRDRSLNRGRSGHKVRSSIISGLPSNASELTKTMIQDGAKRALKKQVINKVMGDSKKDAESRERKKSRKTPRDSEGLPTPRDPAQTKTKQRVFKSLRLLSRKVEIGRHSRNMTRAQ